MNKIDANERIARSWIEAFNAHDLEKLLCLYHDDAVHFSPKLRVREPLTNGWITGKVSLRSWWADAFARLPLLQYQLQNLIINDRQVLMEYLRTVPGEDDLMVAEVLEIEDGRIIKSRVYHA